MFLFLFFFVKKKKKPTYYTDYSFNILGSLLNIIHVKNLIILSVFLNKTFAITLIHHKCINTILLVLIFSIKSNRIFDPKKKIFLKNLIDLNQFNFKHLYLYKNRDSFFNLIVLTSYWIGIESNFLSNKLRAKNIYNLIDKLVIILSIIAPERKVFMPVI